MANIMSICREFMYYEGKWMAYMMSICRELMYYEKKVDGIYDEHMP
jgi:hypothetical protein